MNDLTQPFQVLTMYIAVYLDNIFISSVRMPNKLLKIGFKECGAAAAAFYRPTLINLKGTQ